MRNWLCCLIVVSGYGEIFFSAGVFFIGIDILRDVKMWESEGFVNVRSISCFCESSLIRRSINKVGVTSLFALKERKYLNIIDGFVCGVR